VQGLRWIMACGAAWLLLGGNAMANDYGARQIGHTGEHLHNSTFGQQKNYIKDDAALDRRLHTLMHDTDALLKRLHAMPAETSGSDPVVNPLDKELGRLLDIALRCNPDLDVPRSELAVLAARTRQAGAATDPMLSFELMNAPAPIGIPTRPHQLMGANTGIGVGIEQDFQSAGKRGLKRDIASKDEALKELELAQKEQDLMLEVTETYYGLFGDVAKRNALRENIQLMGILVEMGQRKLAIGVTPQAAVLSAQVQESKMELMATELDTQIEQGYIKLAGLLGYPPGLDLHAELKFDVPYPLPPQITWDNDALEPAALARYPDYQRQCLLQKQQDLQVELAKRMYIPDYTLMGRYDAAFGMQDSYSFEVRVPLFLHKEEHQDAYAQEQYAQKAVITDQAQGIADSFFVRLEGLEAELGMHGKLVDQLRLGTVPQARLGLESNLAAYAGEQVDYSDLLMSEQSLLDQETDLEQNYIHILHTLADLHILTLGAFDPAPYFAPSGQSMQVAERALPLSSAGAMTRGASAAASISTAAYEVAAALDFIGPSDGANGKLGIPGQGFVQDLGLPKKKVESKPAQPKPKQEEKPKEQPKSAAPKSDGRTDPNSDFYKPFHPKVAK